MVETEVQELASLYTSFHAPHDVLITCFPGSLLTSGHNLIFDYMATLQSLKLYHTLSACY